MRVFAVDRAEDGEHLDPRPVNNELRSVIGRLNHLDWWAFPTAGGAAAIEAYALGAFGRFARSEQTTDQTVDVSGRQVYANGVSSPAVIVKQIPDSSGDPWLTTIETVDGFLSVDLMAVVSFAAEFMHVRVGVVVDGAWAMLGAPSADHADVSTHTLHASGILPVGAGTHRVEMLVAYQNTTFSDQQVTFSDRRVVLREVCR